MVEQETEIQAIERLEAALARIAAHVAKPAEAERRDDIKDALDRMIGQLRAALDEAERVEQG
ncbi:MAG: hypothetical protein B7Z59_10700 [Acidiphilium sp. 37-67-22]|jgi:hypothetical protein|uniref:hypothetical protein n=1 Tax=unclassified Acidiphilium TaxID=2617493 RepID=UPI000BDD1CAB|nr:MULTISPECIES: hypothetical protein [unclassified Acidiphilium]OYV82297.1 MAG: hypothetical protein B7Z64_09715 [Acidiphilium sp. 21-68-69]OYW08052.1 MAG: hypothetical protein B7Z59_10700 [Acidiphilium sp. 37-67-22]OYV56443.1 MAG: hypothetical protein B7Z76_05925 [Acidiphilium sp. 20-67-58]HQT59876.1 hypothetical protein [Acidiphilium sp.]HQT75091.1 hypothetical protein [Acidiphilium sp.]